MKKIINIILICFILLNLISIFRNFSYARDPLIDNLINDPDIKNRMEDPVDPNSDELFTGINRAIGLLQIVGTGVAVIVVSMLGIKYMLASPGEKAETKKLIMPIIIGCVLVFGGVNIVAIIAKFVIESTK